MQLDLKAVIGALFCVYGSILSVYGLMSDPALYARSLGLNVNLGWGLALLAFGLCLVGFSKHPDGE
jgi:hypothetical protein